MFGIDSYAAWLAIRNAEFNLLSYQPLAIEIYKVLPDSLIVFKVIMFLCLFVSLLGFYFIARKFFKDKALYIIFLLVSLGPLLIFEFAKFENELFAWPFMIWGMFWLSCKTPKLFVLGMVCLIISTQFWFWPGYFAQFLGLTSYHFLNFGSTVFEQQLFSGVLPMFFLLFFVPFIFLRRNKWFLLLAGLFLIIFLFQSKLWVFFYVFLVFGIGQLLELLEERNINYNFLIVLGFILLIGFQFSVISQVPTQNDWEIVDKTIEYGEYYNRAIQNDWSVGYWLKIRGQETKSYGGGRNPDYNELSQPYIALTDSNLAPQGCGFLDGFFLPTRSLMIWKCK